MKIKTILLCTATLIIGGYSAHAQTSGPRYVPRPEIYQGNYTQANRMEDREDAESYELYEHREPCQRYRRLPRNYADNCANEDITITTVEETISENRLLPVVHSYTILFDFDKSTVRPGEIETLNRIMREIDKYDPRQVTVTGYADSSGRADYNQDLSRRREQAVSMALLERGIQNQTLERDARGEYDQAVKTADDTRNQENRRVVIDLRR